MVIEMQHSNCNLEFVHWEPHPLHHHQGLSMDTVYFTTSLCLFIGCLVVYMVSRCRLWFRTKHDLEQMCHILSVGKKSQGCHGYVLCPLRALFVESISWALSGWVSFVATFVPFYRICLWYTFRLGRTHLSQYMTRCSSNLLSDP
jgi:hypothetical protein